MIKYQVSYSNPLSGFVQIEMIFVAHQDKLTFQIPSWRPGRYEIGNFAQKIQTVSCKVKGKLVEATKTRKDRWVVQVKTGDLIAFSYQFHARQMDAGGSWLDEKQLYINPVNCMMTVLGLEMQPCELTLKIPSTYKVACELPQKSGYKFLANDFDNLVDAPFLASADLKCETYFVGETEFLIWYLGESKIDWEAVAKQFKAFSQVQIDTLGSLPTKAYHFIFQILPFPSYHGVEHANSTVITLGPGATLDKWENLKELLGVSSHELFHFWNVKRIRPKEMVPYDFSGENYFETGYVAEGITTYYGDLFLKRAQVFSWEDYKFELEKSLQRHIHNFGRFNKSLAESSIDLWLDGYRLGIPDRKVSIYTKGALVAWMMDLEIRIATSGSKSLDDLMRSLWQRYLAGEKGYDTSLIKAELAAITSTNWNDFFDAYIYGVEPIEAKLTTQLKRLGLRLETNESGKWWEDYLGIKLKKQRRAGKVQLLVKQIAPNSPAEHLFQLDDIFLQVNGSKLKGRLKKSIDHSEAFEIDIQRWNSLRKVTGKFGTGPYFPLFNLRKLDERNELMKAWLND